MKSFILLLLTKLFKWIIEASSDSFSIAISASLKIALLVSPAVLVFEKITKWTIDQQDYILVVLGAITVDYFFGVWKHLIKGTFDWGDNVKGLFIKLTLTVAGGFLFEGLHSLATDSYVVVSLFKMGSRILVFMYPAASAFKNISIVSGGRFPPIGWFEKQEKFAKTLNPTDLFPKNTSENETENENESN